ncbi:hypothetical protein ABPG74_013681 [Tetrahymena malaccensis]
MGCFVSKNQQLKNQNQKNKSSKQDGNIQNQEIEQRCDLDTNQAILNDKNTYEQKQQNIIRQSKKEQLENEQLQKMNRRINQNKINMYGCNQQQQLSSQQNYSQQYDINRQTIQDKPLNQFNSISQSYITEHQYLSDFSENQLAKMRNINESKTYLLSSNFSTNYSTKLSSDQSVSNHYSIFSNTSIQSGTLELKQKELLEKTEQTINQSDQKVIKVNKQLQENNQQQFLSSTQVLFNLNDSSSFQDLQKQQSSQINNTQYQTILKQTKSNSNANDTQNTIQDLQSQKNYYNLQPTGNDNYKSYLENTKSFENNYCQQNIITNDQKKQNVLKEVFEEKDEEEDDVEQEEQDEGQQDEDEKEQEQQGQEQVDDKEEWQQTYEFNQFNQNIEINALKQIQNDKNYQASFYNQDVDYFHQKINKIQFNLQHLNNQNQQIYQEQIQNLNPIYSVREEGNFETQPQNDSINSIGEEQSFKSNRNEMQESLHFSQITKKQRCSILGHKSNSTKTKFDLYFQMIKLNNFNQIEITDYKNHQLSLEKLDFQDLIYYKQFTIFKKYQYFQQNENYKSKDQKMQELQESEQVEQQMFNKIEQNNYNLQVCGQEIALLALKNIYSQKDITLLFKKQKKEDYDDDDENIQNNYHSTNSYYEQNPNQQEDSYEDIQKHYAQTGFYFEKFYRIKLNDNQEWYYSKADEQKQKFAKYFKSQIIKKYQNLKEDDITILNVQKGSIIVDFMCPQHIENIQIGDQKFDVIPTKYIISQLEIAEDFFDPEYDMQWEETDDLYYRGNINGQEQQYHLPVGYFGLGLKVLNNGIYPNDGWLNSDTSDSTWIVLFHSTRPEFVNKIIQERFKAGDGQYYEESSCRFGRGQVGIGVYFSNKIENCEEYGAPIKIGKKKYSLIFQCRVDPKTVKSPEEEEEYYVCNNPQDTRPYRLLIKEYEDNEES